MARYTQKMIEARAETASRMTATDITVCVCCAMAAANADTSGHEAHCDATAPAPLSQVSSGHVVIGDDVDAFSRTACDGCGETLAGERLSATILEGE